MSTATGPQAKAPTTSEESVAAILRVRRGPAPAVALGTLAGVLVVLQAYLLSRTIDRAFLHGAALLGLALRRRRRAGLSDPERHGRPPSSGRWSRASTRRGA